MKLGRGVLILMMGILLPILSWADEIRIPFSIKQEMFRKEMKKHGMNLDGKDDSDGETKYTSKGFSVFTYKSATPEQMDLIRDTAWKCVRK